MSDLPQDRWVEFGPLQDAYLRAAFTSTAAAITFVKYEDHPLLFETFVCQFHAAATTVRRTLGSWKATANWTVARAAELRAAYTTAKAGGVTQILPAQVVALVLGYHSRSC